MPNKFWQFRNMADGSGELLLYGNIAGEKSWYSDDVTPKQFAEDLAGLGTVSNITVRINSGGGDVFAAVEIGNLLEQHPAMVTAQIDGLCASAATVVACHCNKVVAANDSTYMVHPVKMGICGYLDAVKMNEYISALATVRENIVTLYAKKTGREKDEVSGWMDATSWWTGPQAKENGFVDELKKALPETCRALFISSDPDDDANLRRFAEGMERGFAEIGIRFAELSLLFRETQDECGYLLTHSDVVFLCGGHVPTQNRFFQDIDLREELRNWDSVLVGVSAGTMNCEELVYAPPEEEGEAVDPNYQRFYPGLGLTRHMIFPHFQDTRYEVVDGLPTLETSLLPDSMGRSIYALVDGSFLLGKDGGEELRGEAYLIENGVLTQISREGDVIPL